MTDRRKEAVSETPGVVTGHFGGYKLTYPRAEMAGVKIGTAETRLADAKWNALADLHAVYGRMAADLERDGHVQQAEGVRKAMAYIDEALGDL